MRPIPMLAWLILSSVACVQAASMTTEGSPPRAGAALAQSATPLPVMDPPSGRFQLIVVPGHAGSPFLIDTTTGCIWHQIHNQQTRRTTFVEVDVENLHWSWGSGAQQTLTSRIDGSNLNDEQKRAMKEGLQKTACGLSNLVLTPGPRAVAGEAPTSAPP